MRSIFPGHFRPTQDDFNALWDGSIFVVDANVLLNLYRYSPATRHELERALNSVKQKLFVPHQAAKEFLKNRLVVTAGQADEYSKAIKTITDLNSVLSNKKKHPFLFDEDLMKFTEHVDNLVAKLNEQQSALLDRLTNNDEILEFVQSLSDGRTGQAFNEAELVSIASEGDKRYKNEVPPGYKDGKKEASGDAYRKFGDLILWKQLIGKAKSESKSVIFVTDDKKEDWWLEQSGRTVGPRTELREEFISEVGKDFWMYTVDKFIEWTARMGDETVSEDVIAEVIEVSQEIKQEANASDFSMKNLLASLNTANKFNQYNISHNNAVTDLANLTSTLTSTSSAADYINRMDSNRLADLANLNSTLTSTSSVADYINRMDSNRLADLANFNSTLTSTSSHADYLNRMDSNRLADLANFNSTLSSTSSLADYINRMDSNRLADLANLNSTPTSTSSLADQINRVNAVPPPASKE